MTVPSTRVERDPHPRVVGLPVRTDPRHVRPRLPSERERSWQTLEGALWDARLTINAVRRETSPRGKEGERMRPVLREVFDFHGLRGPPWVCLVARKGARRDDIAFWMERRGWTTGVSKGGRRIYGEGLEEGRAYDVAPSAG